MTRVCSSARRVTRDHAPVHEALTENRGRAGQIGRSHPECRFIMRTASVFALATAFIVALPAHAAVLRTAPVFVEMGGDLIFGPARFPPFDASLGTLNSVTLSFEGELVFYASAFVVGPPPHRQELKVDLIVSYGEHYLYNSALYSVSLTPLIAPITIKEDTSYAT